MKQFISFEEARKISRSIGIPTSKKWSEYWRKNLKELGIPSNPQIKYKNDGWISWEDFCGFDSSKNKSHKQKYISYDELKDILRPFNFSSVKEYNKWYSKNKDIISIPAVPKRCYKEFISWNDLLGNEIYQSKGKTYVSYDEAKKFASSLNLTGKNDWVDYCKCHNIPNGIPTGMCVRTVYIRDGVDFSWGDFLGTGKTSIRNCKYSIDDIKNICENELCYSQTDYVNLYKSKKYRGIPYNPTKTLGCKWEDILLVKWTYDGCKEILKDYNFKTVSELYKAISDESNELYHKLPSNPMKTFKDDWNGWFDYAGIDTISNKKLHIDKLKHRSSICKTLIDKSDLLLMDKSIIRLLYIYLKYFDSVLSHKLADVLDLSAEERVETISELLGTINDELESSDLIDEDEYDDIYIDDTCSDEDGYDIIFDDEHICLSDESEDDEKLIAIEEIMDEFDIESLDDKSKKHINEALEDYIKKTTYKEILEEGY